MADIGYIALVLALVASIYAIIAFIYVARIGHEALAESARNATIAIFGLVTIAVGIMLTALLTHNFRLEYVASYSSRGMSPVYLITALWAGNSGSLLFWAWLLSLAAMVTILTMRSAGKELIPHAFPVIMLTQAFFLILLLSVSNPFGQLSFTPADGRGLNPMLENPGMIVHPPLLLAGYVGFTIPFAFAVAALLSGRLDDRWIAATRRWTLITWLFLGAGNLIGAWWAYVELGWGGYWAWDPVENAGLMPWLVATAFLHSVMMQKRRGMFRAWNMVLMILAFNLAIFGTFLTRSGVLSSVHTFSETQLGPLFLAFLGIMFFGSLALVYYRREELRGEVEMDSLISRESTYLLNNLLLVGATFAILLGTVFPAISEAVRGVKVTVGPSFFNRVSGPIFLALILLIGICTLLGWRRAATKKLIRQFSLPLTVAVVLGIALSIWVVKQQYAVFAFSVCAFVLVAILYDWLRTTGARHRTRGENHLKAFFGLIGANKPRYGGYLVHIAMLLISLGVVGSSFFSTEKEATLKPGESLTIERYTVTFLNMEPYQTLDAEVVAATLSIQNEGKPAGRLTTEKYFHRSFEQPVTEVAIRSTPVEDLYVILAGWSEDGSTSFKVLVNPLVMWIWIGGGILVLGGALAFWPDRRETTAETVKEAT